MLSFNDSTRLDLLELMERRIYEELRIAALSSFNVYTHYIKSYTCECCGERYTVNYLKEDNDRFCKSCLCYRIGGN